MRGQVLIDRITAAEVAFGARNFVDNLPFPEHFGPDYLEKTEDGISILNPVLQLLANLIEREGRIRLVEENAPCTIVFPPDSTIGAYDALTEIRTDELNEVFHIGCRNTRLVTLPFEVCLKPRHRVVVVTKLRS